jgi:hypothetical protein
MLSLLESSLTRALSSSMVKLFMSPIKGCSMLVVYTQTCGLSSAV